MRRAKLTSSLPQIIDRASAGVRLANAASARKIAAVAAAGAPRLTGDLADSVEAVGGVGTDERVVVGDWKAHLIEFGTATQAARPFLVPAAEAERLPHAHAVAEVYRAAG